MQKVGKMTDVKNINQLIISSVFGTDPEGKRYLNLLQAATRKAAAGHATSVSENAGYSLSQPPVVRCDRQAYIRGFTAKFIEQYGVELMAEDVPADGIAHLCLMLGLGVGMAQREQALKSEVQILEQEIRDLGSEPVAQSPGTIRVDKGNTVGALSEIDTPEIITVLGMFANLPESRYYQRGIEIGRSIHLHANAATNGR